MDGYQSGDSKSSTITSLSATIKGTSRQNVRSLPATIDRYDPSNTGSSVAERRRNKSDLQLKDRISAQPKIIRVVTIPPAVDAATLAREVSVGFGEEP